MNRRRFVLVTVLLGFVGATAVPTFAAPTLSSKPSRDDLCVVLAMDDQGDTTKDFCITWPSPV